MHLRHLQQLELEHQLLEHQLLAHQPFCHLSLLLLSFYCPEIEMKIVFPQNRQKFENWILLTNLGISLSVGNKALMTSCLRGCLPSLESKKWEAWPPTLSLSSGSSLGVSLYWADKSCLQGSDTWIFIGLELDSNFSVNPTLRPKRQYLKYSFWVPFLITLLYL